MTESRRRLVRAATDIVGWSVCIGIAAASAYCFRLFLSHRSGVKSEFFYVGVALLAIWCAIRLVASVARFVRLSGLAAHGDMDARERGAATLPALSDALTRGQRGWLQRSAIVLIALVIIVAIVQIIRTSAVGAADIAVGAVGPIVGAAYLLFVATPRGKDRPAFPQFLGAYPLAEDSRPDAVRALDQACIALGICSRPSLFAVPVDSVNAFVEGDLSTSVVGLTHGLLRVMYPDEMVAIFADLLVRLEPGLVAFTGTALMGAPIGIPGLQDVTSTLDLLAACDDAAVLATRDPGALARALKKTAAAESTALAGVGEHAAAFFWAPPTLTTESQAESDELRRLELLRPVAGLDAR